MSNNTIFKTFSPEVILKNLNRSINLVVSNISCYCNDSVSDFTRNRKLPVDELIKFLIQKQSRSANCELNDFFLNVDLLPTTSALIQQRNKLDSLALKRIMDLFTQNQDNYSTYKGYHVLAQDGSDLNIPFLNDETKCKSSKGDPYCQYHLNALFDCINHVFYDVNIDLPGKKQEVASLIQIILEHNFPLNSLILCDRGYESYNLFACCIENNQKFAIRVKDTTSNCGILKNVELPDGEFDINIKKVLTRKQTKEIKNNKSKYTFIPSTSHFDYLGIDEDFYEMELRVVRFKIADDTYECLITNLDSDEFSLKELKELYHMRWSEEVSFRMLKYTIGTIYFNSKKRNFIQQEIYAGLIMYNLCSIIINNVELNQNKKKKYIDKPNFAVAVTNIRNFIKGILDSNEIIKRIKKFLVPVRPERRFKRKVIPQSVQSLNHRVA